MIMERRCHFMMAIFNGGGMRKNERKGKKVRTNRGHNKMMNK
jgi:hypothetical protein